MPRDESSAPAPCAAATRIAASTRNTTAHADISHINTVPVRAVARMPRKFVPVMATANNTAHTLYGI